MLRLIFGHRGESYIPATQKMFDKNAKFEETIINQVYSNDTYIGINKYYINGKWCEKGYVELGVSERDIDIFLIAWDDTVSYDDLEKIAKSFDRNLPEELGKK